MDDLTKCDYCNNVATHDYDPFKCDVYNADPLTDGAANLCDDCFGARADDI